MRYIGIDIAKNTHVVASRMVDGAPHGKAFQFANDERGFRSLLERFAELEAGPDDCIVAMESTGHYWLALWSFLDDHGYPVAVVNPVMTDAFRKADSVRKPLRLFTFLLNAPFPRHPKRPVRTFIPRPSPRRSSQRNREQSP